MKIQFVQTWETGALALLAPAKGAFPFAPELKTPLKTTWAYLQALVKEGLLKTDKAEVHSLVDPRPGKLFALTLGDAPTPDLRVLGAKLGKKLHKAEVERLTLVLPAAADHALCSGFERLMEGLFLGLYQYEEFKKPTAPAPLTLKQIQILGKKTPALAQALHRAQVLAEATNFARDLGNRPANRCTPTDLKNACAQVAQEHGLHFSALDEAAMAQQNMGCLLGVSKGSSEPAWLNILEYRSGKKKAPTLLLVGKGLTFDAGGISLKPAAGMEEMKFDMMGGAGVLGAMLALAQLKPAINVVGIIPASENLPGPSANKPGDVLTACNGTTVEVINTDAEGRLILADALAYGIKTYQPDAVIDMATLTGACMVALGSYHSGMLTNDAALKARVQQAADLSGDPVWELPSSDVYFKQIEGSITDLKNTGGKDAGTITAGLFLKQFVGQTPWVHLDIAGTAWNVERIDYYPAKGATGTGVRLLAELAMNWK